jgi:solute carrier family 25 (mitochondrial phosphate transporter), member 3
MFPSHGALTIHFAPQHPLTRVKSQPHSAARSSAIKRDPFPAWSAVDDIKKKADAFAKEAAREFDVASKKAQAKTGHIELYSPKYYAACIFGGLLACVSIRSGSL